MDRPSETTEQETRPHRIFHEAKEAVDYIAQCLESDTSIQLLAELSDSSRRVHGSSRSVDRFKEIFGQLQRIHAEHDLRQLYAAARFPSEHTRYQLEGYLARCADLTIEFVRGVEGWHLDRIDYL